MTPQDLSFSCIIETENEGNEVDCHDSYYQKPANAVMCEREDASDDDEVSQEVLAFSAEVASCGGGS